MTPRGYEAPGSQFKIQITEVKWPNGPRTVGSNDKKLESENLVGPSLYGRKRLTV